MKNGIFRKLPKKSIDIGNKDGVMKCPSKYEFGSVMLAYDDALFKLLVSGIRKQCATIKKKNKKKNKND